MMDAAAALQSELALSQSATPPELGRARTIEGARKVAEEFEAFFLGQMLKPMFEGIEVKKPFGGGPAEDLWRNMQVEEYGKSLARAGGIGIADAVFKEIIRMQEAR